MEHPVTRMLRAYLSMKREDLKELWASGAFSASLETEMIAKNAGATGACSAYQDILDMDYQKLKDGLSNE